LLAFSFSSTLKVVTLFRPALVLAFEREDFLKTSSVEDTHQRVELRLQRQLALGRKFTTLPSRGLIGGAMILLLLIPVFVLVTQHDPARGIYVP
jgi:hypothetical protein